MTTNRDTSQNHPITTSLENLSKGVNRILKRWADPKKPTKLSLLNDLAQAIRPGANWGALKASKLEGAPTIITDYDATPFVMYRKDRVSFLAGADGLREYKVWARYRDHRYPSWKHSPRHRP